MNAMENIVTAEMNERLMMPFTAEEVLYAIKQMHPTKALRPKGRTPLFFQKFWYFISCDALDVVLGILNFGNYPTLLNHTNIILIPKIKQPKTPKDSISLCNVIFRIITKTIANRLKSTLPHVISISQNVMKAFEIFHSMKKRKKGNKGFMALKFNMNKAYDRVEWKFLQAVMHKLRFHENWIGLIIRYVTIVSYSVLINGNNASPFNPERGLQQGIPSLLICSYFVQRRSPTFFLRLRKRGKSTALRLRGKLLLYHICSLPMTRSSLLELIQERRRKSKILSTSMRERRAKG